MEDCSIASSSSWFLSASAKLGAFETKVLKASASIGSDIDSANELIKKNEQILQLHNIEF